MGVKFQFLLDGFDTIQCAYFLSAENGGGIDFDQLAKEREYIRAAKRKEPVTVRLTSRYLQGGRWH